MKYLILVIVMNLFMGCSSARKSFVYGGLAGGAMGAFAGTSLSPDDYSKAPNALIWGSIGVLLGGALGYLFYKDDPENRDLPQMILKDPERKIEVDDVTMAPIMTVPYKQYDIPREDLPENLRGKVAKPLVIEHMVPERIEKLENGRTIIVNEHKAVEILYEQ